MSVCVGNIFVGLGEGRGVSLRRNNKVVALTSKAWVVDTYKSSFGDEDVSPALMKPMSRGQTRPEDKQCKHIL